MSRLDAPSVHQITPDRFLVSTSCHECFLDIERTRGGDVFVDIQVSRLSTHQGWWSRGMGPRIREAWRVLRGDWPTFVEILGREELDAFIEGLTRARDIATPLNVNLPVPPYHPDKEHI
jgi:hypothetical protein